MLIDGQLVETRAHVSRRSTRPPARSLATPRTPRSPTPRPPIAAARRAFDTTDWATDVELRIRCLEQLHQALLDHREELRELTIAEVGATPALTPGAAARPADPDRPLLRRTAEDYPMTEDLGNIESRGQQHHRWVEKEAGRGGRGHHRVQLPQPAGAGQARARAGGRLHRGAQGRAGHPAGHAGAR